MGDEAVDVVDEVVVEAEDAQLGEAGEGAHLSVGNLEVVITMQMCSRVQYKLIYQVKCTSF